MCEPQKSSKVVYVLSAAGAAAVLWLAVHAKETPAPAVRAVAPVPASPGFPWVAVCATAVAASLITLGVVVLVRAARRRRESVPVPVVVPQRQLTRGPVRVPLELTAKAPSAREQMRG